MSDKALILLSNEVPSISLGVEAISLKEAALDFAAPVRKVDDQETQEVAVQAQVELKRVLNLFERARVEATQPFLAAQRNLKAAVDQQKAVLEAELMRISRLVGDYQALQDAKRRAAEAAQRVELEKAERERQEALSKAQSHAQLEKINEDFNRKNAAITSEPLPDPIRAKGQVVRDEWVIDGLNDWTLLKARPDLVRKIEFDMVAIKKELEAALFKPEADREAYIKLRLPGVKAHCEKKASVRLTGQPKAIEI